MDLFLTFFFFLLDSVRHPCLAFSFDRRGRRCTYPLPTILSMNLSQTRLASSDKLHSTYFPFPPSPPSSTSVTTPSSPQLEHPSRTSLDFTSISLNSLNSSPTLRRASSEGYQQHGLLKQLDPAFTVPTRSLRTSLTNPSIPPTRLSIRQYPTRALTLPSSRPDYLSQLQHTPQPSSTMTISRPPSPSSDDSLSLKSPDLSDAIVPLAPLQSSSTGMGRKVAESLQLFKESSTTPTDDLPHRQLCTPTHRTKPSKPSKHSLAGERTSEQDAGEAEPEYEFVKRSAWPDRENAALRREKSVTTLGRVRTRESVSSTGRDPERDGESSKRASDIISKETRQLTKDGSTFDAHTWRKEISGKHDPSTSSSGLGTVTRGRQQHRPSWKDAAEFEEGSSRFVIPSSSDSSNSAASTTTLQDRYTSQNSPSKKSRSAKRSRSRSVRADSSTTTRSPSRRLPTGISALTPISVVSDKSSDPNLSAPSSHHPLRQSPSPSPTVPVPISRRTDYPEDYTPAVSPTPAPTPFWTTEDDQDYDFDSESAWETASVTTSASTRTSPPLPSPDFVQTELPDVGLDAQPTYISSHEGKNHGFGIDHVGLDKGDLQSPGRRGLRPSYPRVRDKAQLDSDSDDDIRGRSPDKHGYSPRFLGSNDVYEVDDTPFQSRLPHIPLKPFRNQVGGHSAIYKFTKRAVCKVSTFSVSCWCNFSVVRR